MMMARRKEGEVEDHSLTVSPSPRRIRFKIRYLDVTHMEPTAEQQPLTHTETQRQ